MSMYNHRPFDPEAFWITKIEQTAGTENAKEVNDALEEAIVDAMADGRMDDVTKDQGRRLEAKKIVGRLTDKARESGKKVLIDWRNEQLALPWDVFSRSVVVINKERRTTVGLMTPMDLELWMQNLRKSAQEHQEKQEEMEKVYRFLMDKFREHESLERAWLMEDRGEGAA